VTRLLAKLAFRNVKRQLGNYLIYFITVSLTVALMFAVDNVIFSSQLQDYAESMDTLNSGLIGITIFISLIVAFVLGYGTSFMLKLRKREFGTYLTLGMTRKNILTIFILETMILCVAALAAGILLGLFLYQGLMGLLTHLMEIDFIFAAYSVKGLVFTVVLVTVVFLLASVTSAIYLNRVSIYQLIHGDRKVEKGVKHPVFWLIVTLISLAAIMGSCAAFHQTMEASFSSFGETNGWPMLYSLMVLAVTIVTFHIGLARSVVNLLLKNKRFCSRGTNTFTLRQLSGKLGANSVMAGALAFLIAFAVIGANVSFIQKVSERASLEKRYPYDISANLDTGNQGPVDIAEAKQIISQYTEIEKEIAFNQIGRAHV
jgi:putative ABC transport system permease protein